MCHVSYSGGKRPSSVWSQMVIKGSINTGLGERKERSGIRGESESARQCQILRRGQVKSRVAKVIFEYGNYIVIGDLIKGSFGGALRTKVRLQCSEQGLESGEK